MLSSYSRMLMVSNAQVLSASSPDFRDIITRQASGVPGIITVQIKEQHPVWLSWFTTIIEEIIKNRNDTHSTIDKIIYHCPLMLACVLALELALWLRLTREGSSGPFSG